MDIYDIVYNIFRFVSGVTLVRVSRVNWTYYNVSNEFISKFYRKRNLPIPSNKKDILFDLSLIDDDLNIIKKFGYNYPYYGLKRSALFDSKSGLKYFLSAISEIPCKDKIYLLFIIEGAAQGNNLELIKIFISEYTKSDLNFGLASAARGGHIDIINFLISKGADEWNMGLDGAAEGGYKNLMDFFISRGACIWDHTLYGAAKGGHEDIIKYVFSKGINNCNTGISGAAAGGHLKWVQYFFNKGNYDYVSERYLLACALCMGAEGGYQEIIDYVINEIPEHMRKRMLKYSWDQAIQLAESNYHIDLANYLKLQKLKYTQPLIYSIYQYDCKSCNIL